MEQVERKAERVKAPTPETDTDPPIVVEEEDYLNDIEENDNKLKEGDIKNIKGEYSIKTPKQTDPKQQPEELKGKFRSKKIDDINSKRVNKEQYLKAVS